MAINVKLWQDILYGLGVLTNKGSANVTQNSLSDSWTAEFDGYTHYDNLMTLGLFPVQTYKAELLLYYHLPLYIVQ